MASPAPLVFIVDDNDDLLRTVARTVKRIGLEVRTSTSARGLLDELATGVRPDVILTDLYMPDLDGLELLDQIRQIDGDVPIVLMTGAASVETAVQAIQKGAYDYLTKPFVPVDVVTATITRALEWRDLRSNNRRLARELSASRRERTVVGATTTLRDVFELVDGVADVDLSVLVTGQSGTGKELIARSIHERSRRASREMVSINCGALSESLLESELFGHVKGAFTGADQARRGLFEQAHGSTLFLDEVGELSLGTQVRLLRVLQEGEVRPVGSNSVRRVDVRIIAATHRDLTEMVREERFREDLYYRLNVVTIELPRLADRMQDLPELANFFLAKHSERMGRSVSGIDPQCMARLRAYSWPGNVRELENAISRAVALSQGSVLMADTLPPHVLNAEHVPGPAPEHSGMPLPFADARNAFERDYLQEVLRIGENITASARIAGLDPSNFRRLLKRHNLKG